MPHPPVSPPELASPAHCGDLLLEMRGRSSGPTQLASTPAVALGPVLEREDLSESQGEKGRRLSCLHQQALPAMSLKETYGLHRRPSNTPLWPGLDSHVPPELCPEPGKGQ